MKKVITISRQFGSAGRSIGRIWRNRRKARKTLVEQMEITQDIRKYAEENKLEYVRDDDSMQKAFEDPPTIVNFFYHNEIKKSAKKGE